MSHVGPLCSLFLVLFFPPCFIWYIVLRVVYNNAKWISWVNKKTCANKNRRQRTGKRGNMRMLQPRSVGKAKKIVEESLYYTILLHISAKDYFSLLIKKKKKNWKSVGGFSNGSVGFGWLILWVFKNMSKVLLLSVREDLIALPKN